MQTQRLPTDSSSLPAPGIMPRHLQGTRAALFYLWGAHTPRATAAETPAMAPAAALQAARARPAMPVLFEDVFIFQ